MITQSLLIATTGAEVGRIERLIDESSFGSDAVTTLCRRATEHDVATVIGLAEQFEDDQDRRDALRAAAIAEQDHVKAPASPSKSLLPSDLEQLVAAAVAGDPTARERLLAEIHPLVLRYCRGRLGRQETVIGSADDVALEICLSVVNELAGYTVKGLSFRAIGRNRTEPMAELPDTPTSHDKPEQLALAGELAERLGGLLHQLTPRQREVCPTSGHGLQVGFRTLVTDPPRTAACRRL